MMKIVVVDDSTVIRETLIQLLKLEPDFEICGQAWDIPSALQLLTQVQPNIVLVDISLDGKESGIQLIQAIKVRYPGLHTLAISLHDSGVYGDRVLKAGGNGYLMKQEAADKLVTAIRQVLNGGMYRSESALPK